VTLPDPRDLRLVPLTPAHAAALVTWRYPAPYEVYGFGDASPDDLLDPGACFHALLAGEELVGFRSYGADGRVPGYDYDAHHPGALDTGGGLRPDLTGRGLGRAAIAAGLALGRALFGPPAFRVTVAAFNQRALRVLGALGFERVDGFAAAQDGRPFEVLLRQEP
jgi:ribosomal-protein-alanine N-acetyltransferase